MSKPPPATNGTTAPAASAVPTPLSATTTTTTNGRASHVTGKKKADAPAVDPVSMYESVRSRIAALEEEEGLEEEEDNRMGPFLSWSFFLPLSFPLGAE